MGRKNQHARVRVRQFFQILAILACLGVLAYAACILFLFPKKSPVPVQSEIASQSAVTSVTAVPEATAVESSRYPATAPADTSGFHAVLEGNTIQLDSSVSWESSDTAVATVDQNGVVTGVHQGKCEMQSGDFSVPVTVRHMEQKDGCTYVDGVLDTAASATNASVAMISLLFIVMAVLFGFFVYRRGASLAVATIAGCVGIVICLLIGLNWHPIYLSNSVWMWIIGAYILVASVAPVWILLQPRDYLSSFLLYAMMAIAAVGVIGAGLTGADAAHMDMPAFTGFYDNLAPTGTSLGYVFPALFVTIACGAISGFHSLVGSGTTAKQLDHERDAKPIAYGGMLIECALALVSLCAVSFIWTEYASGEIVTPTQVFATGISRMIASIPGLAGTQATVSSLLVLTVSVFCLTSLDTATRLARYMFQEFWLKPGQTYKEATGFKAILTNPVVATAITVVLGVGLGMTGYSKIWPLFGAANQLLAALALLAVCAWLGNIGKNNKMFYIPMIFMLIVTLTSLAQTISTQVGKITAGAATDWAPYAQAILGVLLFILAIVLAVEGCMTIFGKKKNTAAK